VSESGVKLGTDVFTGFYIYDCGRSGLTENADSSCLFRAMAHQLQRPFSDAALIRHELVDYLKDNSSLFSDLVSYLILISIQQYLYSADMISFYYSL